MARPTTRRKPLGTIWEVYYELWRRIEPILLDFWPKKPTGRRVADWRTMNWLHSLYYEPWPWEAMYSRRGKWCNRLRAPDWRELFEQYFEVVCFEELRYG